jgi:hypothetical protein
MASKEQILKQKITNFILYAEKLFPDNKILIEKFKNYLVNMNAFLSDMIQISNFIKKEGENTEIIIKFLEMNGITKKIAAEDITKINRYLQMFIKILE